MATEGIAAYQRAALGDTQLQDLIERAWRACLDDATAAAEIGELLAVDPKDLPTVSPIGVVPPKSYIGVFETLVVIGLKAYGTGVLKGLAGAAGVATGRRIWNRFIAGRVRTENAAALGASAPVPLPSAPARPND